jgi:hypothetical protein
MRKTTPMPKSVNQNHRNIVRNRRLTAAPAGLGARRDSPRRARL